MPREVRFDVLGQLAALRRYAQSRAAMSMPRIWCTMRWCAYEKRASFHTGADLKVWLLSVLHNVYLVGSRARYAEAQRRARVRYSKPSCTARQLLVRYDPASIATTTRSRR
jgi:hypothetical protein